MKNYDEMHYVDCLHCGTLNYFLPWFGYIWCWGCNKFLDLTEKPLLDSVCVPLNQDGSVKNERKTE